MKKFLSMMMALVIAVSASAVCSASYKSEPQTTVTTEDWGNGFTAVVTTNIYDSGAMTRATPTRDTDRTWTIYYGSTNVGTVKLEVTFAYNGSSAWVTDSKASHTTKPGWTYSNQRITESTGKCSVSGRFTGTGTVNFTKSISCSPSGVIS